MDDKTPEIDTLEEAVYSRGWLMGLIVSFVGCAALALILLWALGYISSEMIGGVLGGVAGTQAAHIAGQIRRTGK